MSYFYLDFDTISGYYPVKIEFIGKGFKTVGKIDFDEFGVATFTGFCDGEYKINL